MLKSLNLEFLSIGERKDVRPVNIGLKRSDNVSKQSSEKELDQIIGRNHSNMELELLSRTRKCMSFFIDNYIL